MPSKSKSTLMGYLPARRAASAPRARKNMDMDPEKLAAARAALGAHSDTEAIDMALDLVLSQARVLTALDDMAEDGGLQDVYDAVGRQGTRRPRARTRKR